MSKASCSVEGCDREAVARGWCPTHWARWRKHGDPLHGGAVHKRREGPCSVEGCAEPHQARGYCRKHYATWQRHGSASGVPTEEGREERWRKQRTTILRRFYGMTLEQYEAMAEAQGGRCALCDTVPKRLRKTKHGEPWTGLVVDHDHNTGRVRGLLCHGCNVAMGRVDRSGLERIAEYLATD